ncbi:glycoside hydrolase family 55 protein [Athelia psychrophila]|uniref:Glycoside hydrolase family 55 protein n=1 Tax=Athelia psychrophila TaxID=1759441 RepID=A0A166L691_9AGAM|nr:glycoside hydrolase family 55 protein [Fibularhizoctonia sp. CBS 109695]
MSASDRQITGFALRLVWVTGAIQASYCATQMADTFALPVARFSQYLHIITVAEAHAFIHETFTTLACTFGFLPLAWSSVPDPIVGAVSGAIGLRVLFLWQREDSTISQGWNAAVIAWALFAWLAIFLQQNGFLSRSPYEEVMDEISADLEKIAELALQHPDSNIRAVNGVEYAFTSEGWVATNRTGGKLTRQAVEALDYEYEFAEAATVVSTGEQLSIPVQRHRNRARPTATFLGYFRGITRALEQRDLVYLQAEYRQLVHTESGYESTGAWPPLTPTRALSTYTVFRNVMTDYGAKVDGVTDRTAAINTAIANGSRCFGGAAQWSSFTITPALDCFPSGTCLVSTPVKPYYFGFAAIDADVHILCSSSGTEWYTRTRTTSTTTSLASSLVLNNIKLSNVTSAVAAADGTIALRGSDADPTADSWSQGNVCTGTDGTAAFTQGALANPAKAAPFLDSPAASSAAAPPNTARTLPATPAVPSLKARRAMEGMVGGGGGGSQSRRAKLANQKQKRLAALALLSREQLGHLHLRRRHYSIFRNYAQTCLDTINCQSAIISTDSASSNNLFSAATMTSHHRHHSLSIAGDQGAMDSSQRIPLYSR